MRPGGLSRLRSLLEDFRQKHSTPALGGGVVTRDEELEFDVVGVRTRDGDPVALEDRWHIGSCGKSMTAALYARLVERGDAEWGAPLSELFPDLADSVDAGWSDITIDDVFVSQAGLRPNLSRAEMRTAWRDPRPIGEQRTEVAKLALTRPPRRPGRFLYSNLGYIIIGAAIERITDLSFEEALTLYVLHPLGITSGGFGAPPELWGHGRPMLQLGIIGLIDIGRAKPIAPDRVEADNPAVMGPAGRVHLNIEDWARFQRVFISDGGGFLRPDTIERLLTTAPGRGQRQAMGWAPAKGIGNVSVGQQGSNTYWVATALIDADRKRTAMVVCNEGSARLLKKTPKLALQFLGD